MEGSARVHNQDRRLIASADGLVRPSRRLGQVCREGGQTVEGGGAATKEQPGPAQTLVRSAQGTEPRLHHAVRTRPAVLTLSLARKTREGHT